MNLCSFLLLSKILFYRTLIRESAHLKVQRLKMEMVKKVDGQGEK